MKPLRPVAEVRIETPNSELFYVTGFREPAYDCARFTITERGTDRILANYTDWPRAWKVLTEQLHIINPEPILRAALKEPT